MSKISHLPRRLFGDGVRIAASGSGSETEPKNPRWMQIAYEGTFRGYRTGPVEFTRETFDTMVRNFRNHPTYKQAPGEANVVHFDYEHSSEMDPREGSIPVHGAPAPAWVRELEVREGPDGKAQLWALAYLGQTILAQITSDPPEYQWTSVGLAPDSLDPVTGEHTGPLLTSVAFTNDPFLQGMVPISIAASMVSEALKAAFSYDRDNMTQPTSAETNDAETSKMDLTKRLATLFKVNPQDDLILAAAENATMAADAMDALMGILGAPDFKAALEAAKSMVEKTSGMGEIVAQLAAAMERIGQVDAQDAEAEAEAVVVSRVGQMGLSGAAAKVASDSLRPAILEMRRNCIDSNPVVMSEKIAKFRQTYPLPEADRALLTRRVFAGAGGAQIGLQADSNGTLTAVPVAPPAPTQAPRTDGRNPSRIALCRDFAGRNVVEKAMSYLRKEQPDFANKDYMTQVRRAGEWLSSN